MEGTNLVGSGMTDGLGHVKSRKTHTAYYADTYFTNLLVRQVPQGVGNPEETASQGIPPGNG